MVSDCSQEQGKKGKRFRSSSNLLYGFIIPVQDAQRITSGELFIHLYSVRVMNFFFCVLMKI